MLDANNSSKIYTQVTPGICMDLFLFQALLFNFAVGEQRIKNQNSIHPMDGFGSPAAQRESKEEAHAIDPVSCHVLGLV